MFDEHKVMRNLHNRIKSWSLRQSTHGACTLLDIACGRGGDIQKWHALGIRNVVGVDAEPAYVHEAKRRLAQLAVSRSFETNDYKFVTVSKDEDIPDFLRTNRLPFRFDTITCHFAIHYFFESEPKARGLLNQVSSMLYTGGVFTCTAMNADRVKALGPEFKNTAMIVTNYETELHFGANVDIHVSGTLYFGECSFSKEFLVYPETLVRLAQENNLVLETRVPFKDFQDLLSVTLSPDTKACSELYDCYVFRKKP